MRDYWGVIVKIRMCVNLGLQGSQNVNIASNDLHSNYEYSLSKLH